MKVRMEIAPDEPIVVVVEIDDDEVTPEMRSEIEALSDETPLDTDELPFGLDALIDWDDAINVHWCVQEIEIEKSKSGCQPDKHGRTKS